MHVSAAGAPLWTRAYTPGHPHAPSSTICGYPAIIQACTSTTARHWAGVLLTAMVLSCSEADSAALLLLEFRPTDTSVVFITYSCYPGPGHGGYGAIASVAFSSSSSLLAPDSGCRKNPSSPKEEGARGKAGGFHQMSFITNLTTPNANPWADPPVRSDPFAVRPHPRAVAKAGHPS